MGGGSGVWPCPLLEARRQGRFITEIPGHGPILVVEGPVRGLGTLGSTSRLELLVLLVKVLIELVAVYDRGVRLLQLVTVEVYKDGLEVIDKLVNPRQVQQRAVDSLGLQYQPWRWGDGEISKCGILEIQSDQGGGGGGLSIHQAMTYNEDDAQFLHESPLQSMLVVSVGGVVRSRPVVLCASGGGLLLDEDIGDEAVDDGRAGGHVASRPQHNARSREDLKRV